MMGTENRPKKTKWEMRVLAGEVIKLSKRREIKLRRNRELLGPPTQLNHSYPQPRDR